MSAIEVEFNNIPYAEALTEKDRQRLKELFSSTDTLDDVWTTFAVSVVGSAATGEPAEKSAKKIFNRMLHRFKVSLCNDPKIRAFIDNQNVSDVLSLAMIFSAKLAADHFDGIDYCAAGLLIAKIGLRNVCETSHIE